MKILYGDLNWLEVKQSARDRRVPLIALSPAALHVPYMPPKTDQFSLILELKIFGEPYED